MSEFLSPEVKETMVAGFSGDGHVLVHDPFNRFDNPIPLEWDDCCNNGYNNLYISSTRILVKMTTEAKGNLIIVPKEERSEKPDF